MLPAPWWGVHPASLTLYHKGVTYSSLAKHCCLFQLRHLLHSCKNLWDSCTLLQTQEFKEVPSHFLVLRPARHNSG